MLDSLFSQLAPHYCLSCGEIGVQICENCFYDIDLGPLDTCYNCHGMLRAQQCTVCTHLHGVMQYVCAERVGVLERLVDDCKFRCQRAATSIVARCFDESLPVLPSTAIVIPVPTAPAHIRQRGFDHTQDITRIFAKRRGLRQFRLLHRRHRHVQVGASRMQRQQQAETAFYIDGRRLASENLYVLLDDVITTGATLSAAIAVLRKHGAQHIVATALLQQPWKK